MSHAQELITAIQTCIPGRVRAVIEQLTKLSDDEVKHLTGSERLWTRKSYINDRLPGGLDITALHLASKAYSAHKEDARLANTFNEMVGDLLAAGASPLIEVGGKKVMECVGGMQLERTTGGQTVAEVCEGRLPPALTDWFAKNCDNTIALTGFSEKKHASTIRRTEARLAAWHERKLEREASLADQMPMEAADTESQLPSAIGF